MYKLSKSRFLHLHSTLKNYYKNPNFLMPTSTLHNSIKTQNPNCSLSYNFTSNEVGRTQFSNPRNQLTHLEADNIESKNRSEQSFQISHPWPEWVELMELLLRRGYFEALGNPFGNSQLAAKDTNCIRTACLNFARDQSGLMRHFSRKDIRVVTVCGCPALDRKVVNSGKRLRAHVGVDEGNVCGSCNLRGECERAYVQPPEEESGRTLDVMRILLTHGLDFNSKIVDNQLCHVKIVKESVRRLLKKMVEYGLKQTGSDSPSRDHSSSHGDGQEKVPMKQGDWICPKCKFLNFARNIRCLRCDCLIKERLQHLFVDQDHLPLKKGDWVCETCNFLNFSKNTRCLRCREKPPKRHLNPGEWECESCNYINFRRNMVCLKCDHRRPKASNTSDASVKPNHVHADNPDTQLPETGAVHGKVVESWRFIEEENDDNQSGRSHNNYKFLDFPVIGGKSILSKNPDRREQWRQEMSWRSKQSESTKEDDKDFKNTNTRKALRYVTSTDDEDMAEWFGHGKKLNE